MSYEKDIVIDETALDIEWLEQPSLMMKYARNSASAKMDLDKAKEALDLVKAELDKHIRINPSKFDIEKITEGAITAAILQHARYKKASEVVIQAQFENNIAQGAVKAFDARKDALENLVRLHGQQYFAGPKMPRDLEWERAERQKHVDAGVASKMTRRTK